MCTHFAPFLTLLSCDVHLTHGSWYPFRKRQIKERGRNLNIYGGTQCRWTTGICPIRAELRRAGFIKKLWTFHPKAEGSTKLKCIQGLSKSIRGSQQGMVANSVKGLAELVQGQAPCVVFHFFFFGLFGFVWGTENSDDGIGVSIDDSPLFSRANKSLPYSVQGAAAVLSSV